ncbi:glycoside hydrolase family 18 protein [Trichocladium antarcticum]|uniref:Glycoside hydrolase family 18 protein n=1 Tax=Trichocladium antarcticum TaxID=1450529 RepID=A0AAN6URR0_9PEZI|nr:glycoside hydrolase family 18 protein [Trichocladium antarcticum]
MAPFPHPALPPALPRLITYYQTHHTPSGKPISILPLLQQPGIGLTHLILAAIHLNEDPSAITLNDHPPAHPRFAILWAELRILQASGIRVLGMLGGAAPGTFTRLDYRDDDDDSDVAAEARFEAYYAPLARLVRDHALDGLDLDVEEPMSLRGIIRLIDRLRADFGRGFTITLAPVAAALLSVTHNLSGFDYEALEVLRGREIAWYNAQFYCGWGDCSNPAMYEMLLAKGWAPERIVVGLVTNPANGNGWVPWAALAGVLPLLVARHPRFGGVMGWEYFNGLPGGEARPWEWAQALTALLRGKRAVEGSAASVEAAGGSPEADPDEGEKDRAAVPVPRAFEYHSDGGEQEE